MRIAYISYEYPTDFDKGGIGTYILHMSKLMQKMGHDIEIFCAKQNDKPSGYHEKIFINRVRCSNPVDFRQKVVDHFSKKHKQKKFSLIESPEVNANGLEIRESFPNIPFVVRMHTPNAIILKYQQAFTPISKKLRYVIGSIKKGQFDLGYWRKQAFYPDKDIEFVITSKANAISVPSNALKEWASSYWGFNREKINVIPNPVSLDVNLLDLEFKPDSKTILYLGRLDVIKGIVNFTKALKKVLHHNPDWKVHFAGKNGPSHIKGLSFKEYIVKTLKEFEKQVFFTENYNLMDLPIILASASICVLPSYFESFSYTCAEAMLAGKAIIGSNRGGMIDLLEGGKCGLLINPHSTRQIIKAINALISSPEKRKHYALNARKRIVTFYNEEQVGNLMHSFYQKVAKN